MTTAPQPLLIAKGKVDSSLLPNMANRHGLVAGATGTGKTVTLRVLAERFSTIGVPVFMADVKGDLSGLALPGEENPKVAERVKTMGLTDFSPGAFPVVFWDVFGTQGHPVRTTVSEMGPLLLSRLLNLNDVQSGVLSLVFKVADDNGMLLLDFKDLQAMVRFVGEKAAELQTAYGNISAASIGAIQRNLLALGEQGADRFFGEPALNLQDFMQTDSDGRGAINILAADQLMQSPKLYSTFLLWMLSELFEQLPEAGDPEKPKLVFFFDEAHLLFDDAPKALVEKIEQVVRLIRSKGVGIYFVTQNPVDLPDTVLGQLGNRVQHALRAFTPKDQKGVRAAAETFRPNPEFTVEQVITELGVGEALVSFLDEKGSPSVVDRALVCPPRSRFTPLSESERTAVIARSPLAGFYEKTVDRQSAFEMLREKAATAATETAAETPQSRAGSGGADQVGALVGAFAKSAAHAIGSQVGRQIIRGLLGSIFGGGRRR